MITSSGHCHRHKSFFEYRFEFKLIFDVDCRAITGLAITHIQVLHWETLRVISGKNLRIGFTPARKKPAVFLQLFDTSSHQQLYALVLSQWTMADSPANQINSSSVSVSQCVFVILPGEAIFVCLINTAAKALYYGPVQLVVG